MKLKSTHYLVAGLLFLNCGSAWANWRDDNPNQPNGYEASMLRYHYGTPDDDGPHDGYEATAIRNRNGLDRFAPPDDSDDGGDSKGGWGGGRFSDGGSGLGRHFRQGQAEGQAYWTNRLQSQVQQRAFQNGTISGANVGGMRSQMPAFGRQMQPVAMSQMPSYARMNAIRQMPGYANQYSNINANNNFNQAANMPRINANYNQFPSNANNFNHHYAPSYGSYNGCYGNSSALQSAVNQRPVRTLLRNGSGGFNRIY